MKAPNVLDYDIEPDGAVVLRFIERRPLMRRRVPANRFVTEDVGSPDTDVATLAVWFERADPKDPHSDPLHPKAIWLEMKDGVSPTELSRFGWSRWMSVADAVARTGGDMTHPLWRSEDVFNPETVQGRANRAYRKDWDLPIKGKRPGRKGYPDDFYKGIANRYLELLARGSRNPTQVIAEQEFASRNTVAGWVRGARDRGFLPPARKGRAG